MCIHVQVYAYKYMFIYVTYIMYMYVPIRYPFVGEVNPVSQLTSVLIPEVTRYSSIVFADR
jgi:hypothetical protein